MQSNAIKCNQNTNLKMYSVYYENNSPMPCEPLCIHGMDSINGVKLYKCKTSLGTFLKALGNYDKGANMNPP